MSVKAVKSIDLTLPNRLFSDLQLWQEMPLQHRHCSGSFCKRIRQNISMPLEILKTTHRCRWAFSITRFHLYWDIRNATQHKLNMELLIYIQMPMASWHYLSHHVNCNWSCRVAAHRSFWFFTYEKSIVQLHVEKGRTCSLQWTTLWKALIVLKLVFCLF